MTIFFKRAAIQLLGLSMVAGAVVAETPLKLGPRKDVTISPRGEGVFEISISGPTPHFWSQPVMVPAAHRILTFEYFSVSGSESISIRFRDSDGTMKFVGSKPLPIAETWQPFAIELSEAPEAETRFHISMKYRPETSFRIRGFMLREPNQAELAARKDREQIQTARSAAADALLKYLRASYPAEIDVVDVGLKTIRISGKSSKPVRLVEVLPHQPSHRPKLLAPPHPIADPSEFAIELPRYVGPQKRDRATSRWRLETMEGEIASLAKWPTKIAIDGAQAGLPKAVARSQKGIGGVPLIDRDDHPIFELGVHHATVNFVIDALMSRTQRPGWKAWEFENRTYYLNEKFLAGKDATIRRLCRNDIVVTCILLVGNSPNAQLKHPDAEPRGVFAMPDLTNEVSAHHYRAVIHFLTERYSKPDLRIANWVMHNEVDQAGTWTNMGDQPLARYLEAYHRSSRIVYHTARRHDPHARVFISLTHHWAKQSSGHGTYMVRKLVDLWSEIAQAEGDFDWGVAYHPYPQNLRNPDTWDDPDVTFEIDTPYITPKNIEVLPKFLGPDRPILLSEQGFNTPTLSLADQKRQSDALIYMFDKLQQLPEIEAFHLHRYQDMPDREGGLRFGLLDEHGNRKLAWQTYVKIGNEPPVNPPDGRLAIVADGNSPDPDDIGAIAVIFGLLKGAGQNDRLVHLSHSCDLEPFKNKGNQSIDAANEKRRQDVLHQVCEDGISHFGPFPNLKAHFNCRADQEAAVNDLREAINASSADDPLWLIEAGEPDIIGYALEAATASKRQFVHVVSHHPANDNSGDFFTWKEILAFGVEEHQIGDQNVGLKTAMRPWDWAKNHRNEGIAWIHDRLEYAERDGVVKFQADHFDCSDAGMVFWWITGADQDGNKKSTPADMKRMLLMNPR